MSLRPSLVAAAFALTASFSGHAAVVESINPAGDAFTVPGTTNQGQAVGATGWYYNNVRNNGTVGIQGTFARSGNGSVYFSGTQGPAGNSSKADIEYYDLAGMGSLGRLTSLSYDWYRDSSSTANANQHPSLRILVDMDGNLLNGIQMGSLNFEMTYNATNYSAPTDAWQSMSIDTSSFFWGSQGLNGQDPNPTGYLFDSTLAQWQAALPNAVIVGFSSGIGSGWGPFEGAVDNISWTIAGVTTTTNFEIGAASQVPEPSSLALIGLGLAGVLGLRRRQRH